MHALRIDQYLLLPTGAVPEEGSSYIAAPVREAQHVLARAVAACDASALLAFWSAHTGHPLVAGPSAGALRRALEWANGALERTPLGLTLWRRVTPRITGELQLRSIPQPPAPPPARVEERDWIEFELLDTEGDPVRGLPFTVSQGESTLLAGKLNRFANVFLERIDPGSYTFALPPEPTPEPLEPSDWIAIELLSEGGRPLAGERFRLLDSAGGVHERQSDAAGRAVLYDVAPGECVLTLLGPEPRPTPPG